MADHVSQLETTLKRVTQERDELARDVESLCLQSENFFSSSVLSERITLAEKQLAMTQTQLNAVVAERDGLKEDLRAVQASKREVGQSWRTALARKEEVEAELAFYQQQSAGAMAERDQASLDAEELRAANLDLENRLSTARQRLEGVQVSLAEVQHQQQASSKQIRRLEHLAQDCEAIPGLKKDLAAAKQRGDRLQSERDALQAALQGEQEALQGAGDKLSASQSSNADLQQQLDHAQSAAQREAGSLQTQIASLQGDSEDLRKRNAALQARADDAESALAAAQAEVEVVTRDRQRSMASLTSQAERRHNDLQAAHVAEASALREELSELRQQHVRSESELRQAIGEKTNAMSRLSAAEASAEQGFAELGERLDEIANLKSTLQKVEREKAEATRQKVDALMQAADARSNRRRATEPSGADPPRSTQRPGWRLFGPAASPAAGAPSEQNGHASGNDSSSTHST